MKPLAGIILVILVSGCDSPHPAFSKVEAKVITVDGSTFRARVRENMAEAIRTNFERLPKIGETFPKAAKAMEIASGCRVIPNSMKGDPALVMAKLDCR